jgi:hypothetical protein
MATQVLRDEDGKLLGVIVEIDWKGVSDDGEYEEYTVYVRTLPSRRDNLWGTTVLGDLT